MKGMTSLLFLSKDDVVDIEGKQFTVQELKDCVIDSALYRKHLQEMEESE